MASRAMPLPLQAESVIFVSISAQSGNGQLAFVGFLRLSKDHRTGTRSHHNDIDRDAVARSVDDSKRVDTKRVAATAWRGHRS